MTCHLLFSYLKGPLIIIFEQMHFMAVSFSLLSTTWKWPEDFLFGENTGGLWKHEKWGIWKGYLFRQNGIEKGKGVDLGAEPARIKLCRLSPPPPPLGALIRLKARRGLLYKKVLLKLPLWTPGVDVLRLNTLRGTISAFWSPKRYDQHPCASTPAPAPLCQHPCTSTPAPAPLSFLNGNFLLSPPGGGGSFKLVLWRCI